MTRSKDKGTLWESAIRDYLQANGWPTVERLPLSGAKDRGDIAGIPGLVIEAKNVRGWDHLGTWIREAEAERINAGARHGVVWAKRAGKTAAADGYVIMSGAAFLDLIREAGF